MQAIMGSLIVSLNSSKKSVLDSHLVGGKAANLAKLHRMGFRSAPGFVITSKAFHRFIDPLDQFGPVDSPGLNAAEYKSLKERIISIPFDRRLENTIWKFHRKLSGSVAVRSSMVGEDRANDSFAGQLDTYLHVEPDRLIEAIKECYASHYKPQLFQYLSARGKLMNARKLDLLSTAVIVQRMVEAETAGIAFTADPICGRSEVIIEAVAGLGKDAVSGGKDPDRYVVNANGKISESAPTEKGRPLLSREQILRLAVSANRIARKMGHPQDIEWAWDGEDFIFLQTRPISTLFGKQIYSNKLVADMSPGVIKPLQWSTYTLSMMTRVFCRLFTEIIGPNNIDFNKAIRLIHSRVYTNINFFNDMLERIGLPGNFFEMIARDEEARRRRPPMSPKLLHSLVFKFIPFIWKYSRAEARINRFINKQNAILNLYRKSDWSGVSINDKYMHLKHLMFLHNEAQQNIMITALNMAIRNTLLKKMIRKHAPSVRSSDLLTGPAGEKGWELNAELDDLSEKVHALGKDIISLCIEGDDGEIRRRLSSSAKGRELISEFDAFMKKYGHLSANTTNFTEPPWIENPKMIWSSMGNKASHRHRKRSAGSESSRAEKRNEVLKHLNPIQKKAFRRILKTTIVYLTLREKISLLLSEDTYQFRRLVLGLGEGLVLKGIIEKPDDVFYLHYDEITKIIEENTQTREIGGKIIRRRRRIEQDAQIIPEDTICGDQIETRPERSICEPEFLTGICGSSGFKQGYAYVVEDPGKINRVLTPRDILVVPFSHVGWTPLFSKIGGIIAETGGQLSHTSIIAREFGIPAVVSVPRAMGAIKTGQPLTLDADKGRIYLKHIHSTQGD